MPESPKETGWFACEGGSIIEMDLPLPEAIAQRVEKGAITQVANADGDPLPDETAPGAPLNDDTDTSKDMTALYTPPPPSASKAAWVGYAVKHGGMTGDAAEACTKQDLVDRFGRS